MSAWRDKRGCRSRGGEVESAAVRPLVRRPGRHEGPADPEQVRSQ